MEECLELLRALSDKTRQEIIMLFVVQKEMRVNEIAKKFTLSRPTISHHLGIMKRSRLIKSRKEGKEIYFSFNKDYVISIMESLIHVMKSCC